MCLKKLFYLSVLILVLTVSVCRGEYGVFTVELEDIDSGTTSPTGQYRWRDVADQLYSENYWNNYNYTKLRIIY